MSEKKELLQTFKNNPGCRAVFDHDQWFLYADREEEPIASGVGTTILDAINEACGGTREIMAITEHLRSRLSEGAGGHRLAVIVGIS